MLQEKVYVVAKPNREKPPSFGLLMTNTAADLQLHIQLLIICDLCVHLHVYRVGRKGPLTCTDPTSRAKALLLQHL